MRTLAMNSLAVIVGASAAIILFPPHTDSFVLTTAIDRLNIRHDFTPERAKGLRYTGMLLTDDREARTLTLEIGPTFPLTSSTTPTRFTYNDETQWFSFEYRFRENILDQRFTHPEDARSLPPGTLVTLTIDPSSASPLVASGIYFMRKTEL
jgi:hypothetical protein